MFHVRAKSQMQNLHAGSRESLDDAVELAKKLQQSSPNGFFTYVVLDGEQQVWPAERVAL